MRIEGHGNGLASYRTSAFGNFAQDFPVAAVNAIEVADRDQTWSEILWNLFQRAKDLHAISNSSFNPSCASLTFSGKPLFVSSWGRSWEICVKKARLG